MSLWQFSMLVSGSIFFFLVGLQPDISIGGLVIGTRISRIDFRGFDLCLQTIVQQLRLNGIFPPPHQVNE